jgi:hypothetical protein
VRRAPNQHPRPPDRVTVDRDREDVILRCRRANHTAPQPLERGAGGAPSRGGTGSGIGDFESRRPKSRMEEANVHGGNFGVRRRRFRGARRGG